MFLVARLAMRLKRSILACLLVAAPWLALAQDGTQPAVAHLRVSQTAPLDRGDPLALWFKEQDRLLDDILVRLSRIEALVGEIHRLIMNLPAPAPAARRTAEPALPVAPAAPSAVPAPPAKTADDETLTDWLPHLGAALLLALLLVRLRQRKAGIPPVETAATTPTVPAAQPSAPSPTRRPGPPLPVETPPPPQHDEQFDQAIELADIMLSMGLGQGAADTLIEQIRQEPKRALRHWLKLLEIYRQAGQQEEFERSAEELRLHFNVRPEDWLALPGAYASLEDYPHIATRLVELWGRPGCLPYLQNLLSDNRGGARSGFPQAVAEEVLLLVTLCQATGPR